MGADCQFRRGADGFNWDYDPFHYTVPEGSYSADPEGPALILEFRQMVQALNQSGLRVVIDVVYNHTNASGQSEKSVLDRVVPGYYHRLDANGSVTNSTYCSNTTTENAMMRKLMIDSVLIWAAAYKVDGFRFDLMGHHMKADMETVRAAVDALAPEADGVDGEMVYIYGEGWDFCEVAGDAPGSMPHRPTWPAPASAPSMTGCAGRCARRQPLQQSAGARLRYRTVHRPQRGQRVVGGQPPQHIDETQRPDSGLIGRKPGRLRSGQLRRADSQRRAS